VGYAGLIYETGITALVVIWRDPRRQTIVQYAASKHAMKERELLFVSTVTNIPAPD